MPVTSMNFQMISLLVNKYKGILLILLIFFAMISICIAQDIPPRPVPPRLVNDFAGILNADETNRLEQKLVTFNDSTSTQLAVVIVPSLNGYDKADFAFKIGEQWGVGQKGKNNGAVILIKPKIGNERGEVFIATGYGLESVLTDAVTRRIIEQEMIPHFREGDYFVGLDAATDVIIELTKGEYTVDQYTKGGKAGPWGALIPLIVFAAVFFLIRSSRARSHSIGKSIPFWTAFWLLGSMGRGHSGSWNNFTGGSGGFGGGGGFGGFGGGSFGGGGAGGSW